MINKSHAASTISCAAPVPPIRNPVVNSLEGEQLASAVARPGRRSYPSPTAIKKLLRAAQDCGIPVGGFEVAPDGRIRVYDRTVCEQADVQDDFDRWEGKL